MALRQKNKDAIQHICEELLEVDMEDALARALKHAGIDRPRRLAAMENPKETIDGWKYSHTNTVDGVSTMVMKPLNDGEKQDILRLIRWFGVLESEGMIDTTSADDIMSLSNDDFRAFCRQTVRQRNIGEEETSTSSTCKETVLASSTTRIPSQIDSSVEGGFEEEKQDKSERMSLSERYDTILNFHEVSEAEAADDKQVPQPYLLDLHKNNTSEDEKKVARPSLSDIYTNLGDFHEPPKDEKKTQRLSLSDMYEHLLDFHEPSDNERRPSMASIGEECGDIQEMPDDKKMQRPSLSDMYEHLLEFHETAENEKRPSMASISEDCDVISKEEKKIQRPSLSDMYDDLVDFHEDEDKIQQRPSLASIGEDYDEVAKLEKKVQRMSLSDMYDDLLDFHEEDEKKMQRPSLASICEDCKDVPDASDGRKDEERLSLLAAAYKEIPDGKKPDRLSLVAAFEHLEDFHNITEPQKPEGRKSTRMSLASAYEDLIDFHDIPDM